MRRNVIKEIADAMTACAEKLDVRMYGGSSMASASRKRYCDSETGMLKVCGCVVESVEVQK